MAAAALGGSFGAGAVLVTTGGGTTLAAWLLVGAGILAAGAVTGLRVKARLEADRARLARLQAELQTRQQALDASRQRLDEAAAARKASEERIARCKAFEERSIELQSQAALGRMAGGVAHSFNNMLVGIMGYASAVEEIHHLTPGEMRQYLSQINTASQRATVLCFQLMVAAGRRTAEGEVVFLRRFRTEIEPLLSACVGRGAALTLELAPNLPRVRADLGGLQVALCNLTFNALDAIAGQGSHLTLSVAPVIVEAAQIGLTPQMSTIEPGPHVLFVMEDDGAGVAPEVRDRIFEPFFTTRSGRMGLGLAAVARWVRQRHGGILVKPLEPRGTRVELYLPAIRDSEEAEDDVRPAVAPTPARAPAAKPAPPPKSRRILFVDDDQTVRDLGSMLIRQLGLEVVCADDGYAAEAAVREQGPFGLALVDYSMPGRDGVETIRLLREHQPDLRIVLISGSIRAEIDGLERVEPLAGFLQKPFNYTAVKELLVELINAG